MKADSKLKSEGEIYTPKSRMPRSKIFRDLCEDPSFPCRDCTDCKKPVTCVRMNDCPRYYIWFSREWKRIRKAMHVKKPKTIMP